MDTSKEYLYGFDWNFGMEYVWNIWFRIPDMNSLFVYVGLGQP